MGPRRRRGLHAFLGFLLGLFLGLLLASPPALLSFLKENLTCTSSTGRTPPKSHQPPPVETDPLKIIDMLDLNENRHNSAKTLLFVGVMTAQKYLPTRAVAVYDTWGKELPGRIAFFSSGTSYPPPAKPRLPLVALRGVDDSYPPQKKSFLMLQYMWQNYGDRFEWFMRADDDVYVRPDKLEKLLRSVDIIKRQFIVACFDLEIRVVPRSVDSKKPQFIGQAGRGNQEEFGLLSLEYDENFCMGGPGVIMSRETLSRVAPHIKYCLKNLYTTHEDVELGRCVQKFAGIPCTWSYEVSSCMIALHPLGMYSNCHPRSCHVAWSLDVTAINRSDTGCVSQQFFLADCRGGLVVVHWIDYPRAQQTHKLSDIAAVDLGGLEVKCSLQELMFVDSNLAGVDY
uniref:Hexosyltransferase n=1 Tax=Timema cristinae TaxID=61476 RepID=A0A7R9CHP3_TIMCR|nr:unnamed protein product [Timema cristinae]